MGFLDRILGRKPPSGKHGGSGLPRFCTTHGVQLH